MTLNPLNELKRRLEDDSTPIPKRLCLAKNVVLSHHFPTAPKETIVATWLEGLVQNNRLDGDELRKVLEWTTVEDLTSDLKSRLIQVLSQYLQKNQIQEENIHHILTFLDNDTISQQITQQIDEYLKIIVTLLQYLREQDNANVSLSQKVMANIVKYYKVCKRKLEFIIKLLDGENLETIFSFLETDCHETVLQVAQNVLFSFNKKSFFVSFLQTLIRKDNISEFIEEKGDSIQSVIKIMSTFFMFPKGRTEKNQEFLSNFIETFVSCFKKESQLVFAFYIMVVNCLNMDQSYLSPAMKMPPIIFEQNDDKVKRNLFLKMLEVLLKYEVDIGVRLTDTFGEKISKVEIKKNFPSFLQAVMMGQLKLEGKVDKTTLHIIHVALKLDPVLIEQKIDQILPPIMSSKKNNLTNKSYVEMLNYLLEILFKLSRGTVFINQILPQIKLCLEASNTDQFELKQKIKECEDNGSNVDSLKGKVITGNDVFPPECVEMFGKWTSELMFRQNKELLVSLQKDFEEHCLMMLEEGFVSPSIITLAELLSAISSSFLRHSKIADHTVPKPISEDFWSHFQQFENECLGKFGKCILKLNYDSRLAHAFLDLSVSVANLKLLNLKYSNTKLDLPTTDTSEVFDLSGLMPCLNSKQWINLASKVTDDQSLLLLDKLLQAKTLAMQLLKSSHNDQNETIISTKNHLIKQVTTTPEILNTCFPEVVFNNLEKAQLKLLAKNLIKTFASNPEIDLMKTNAVMNNRNLLNALVIENAKNMAKCFENIDDFFKALNKSDFDFSACGKDINMATFFEEISLKEDQENEVSSCITLYRQLQLPYLEESYQLVAIFLLLCAKKSCQKKIRKSVDHILLNIFEMSPKYPDIYKIFTADTIFSFEDKTVLNLLTLKIKTSNSMFIIKSILESAVKKVKTNSDIVKSIVDLLLSQQKGKKEDTSSIEYFSDPVFQITCIILPIIAKEKRAITTSNFRSILANLQENLHKSLLKCFKTISFDSNTSLLNETIGNIDDSMVVSENTLASLNAMAAFSLTLSKYCETNDAEEMKNLEYLWSGFEFFIQKALSSIKTPTTKTQHVESSIQLLNITLRHLKKLESHTIFQNKEKIFAEIWESIVERLKIVFGQERRVVLDEFAVTLKFLCELTSVETFTTKVIGDLISLGVISSDMKPSDLQKDQSVATSHKVSKYLWCQILKANLLGPKCVALSKLLSKMSKELRFWIQTHYGDDDDLKLATVGDEVCELLKIDLDVIAEAVLAAKKINLDYKLLDSICSLLHQILSIISSAPSSSGLFQLFEGCLAVLNSLVMSREELLEDRWPNVMQCHRALVSRLCACASAQAELQRHQQDKLAEIAHSLEKLTQSICKRTRHVSRIAAYTVGDVCAAVERAGPATRVRTHLDNVAATLLQAAESSYCAASLRRALAGAPGHATLANLYAVYKRYHKYVGNS
ncbi:urb2/Npa2 family domain-containing protein [Phthorimaea operculella]|nr:urb2/Npa2 family domain-containing protein [Phthorimaea operculella]